jgi:putative radical SAM enzyme (TIGR03279 family)
LPSDVIRRVDGEPVDDIIDFRFRTSEEQFEIEFVRDGVYHTVQLERNWGQDLGLRFTFELADQIHTCDNKCVFCFIHQMPKGMRKSLYLMDDDFRLSFLHGNYVTLTNMSEEEFERTKEQGLSPLYVSVHATEPRLRGFMLGRGAPEPILPRLKDLIKAGIDVHCQVVLCPGLNDGDSLERTVHELAELHQRRTGLRAGVLSVAVVPVGLTRFRQNLYPIRQVTPEYSRQFLCRADSWHKEFLQRLGTRFVFPTDEWYFYAGRAIPSRKFYEDFPQFEDGVGTCRMFLEESKRGLKSLPASIGERTSLTLITGRLPERVIANFGDNLSKVENLEVSTIAIENRFFGSGITIAGLITAQDLIETLKTIRPKGIVAVPDIAVKDECLFLDDKTIEDVKFETQCDVRICPASAKRFLKEWLPKNVLHSTQPLKN